MTRLKKIIIVVAVLTLSIIDFAFSEILTNELVINMAKVELGDEIIISIIEKSDNQFDTSIDSILKLKEMGISENIIKSMIVNSGKSDGDKKIVKLKPKIIGTSDNMSEGIINASSIFIKQDNRVIEIPKLIAEVSQSMKKVFIPFYFGPHDTWYYIRGNKSLRKLKSKKPIFYTKMSPNGLQLVRLSYHSKKDIRYVIKTGSNYNNTINMSFDEKPDGIFEMFPDHDLGIGEYAFIDSMYIYDFSIE